MLPSRTRSVTGVEPSVGGSVWRLSRSADGKLGPGLLSGQGYSFARPVLGAQLAEILAGTSHLAERNVA
jgi:hypothetical protein